MIFKSRLTIPKIGIIDRYIMTELIVPFLFGMGLFTSLGLAVGTLFELIRKVTEAGLPMTVGIQVLLLRMPAFIVLAFPMSMLLASLMAYSRLASDSEIVALRSAGISIYRIVIPGILLSLIVTGLAFVVNDLVAPAATYQASITLEKALGEEKPNFKERNIIYPEYKEVKQPDGSKETVLNRLFYAEEFNGKEMKDLIILDRSQGEVNQITTSKAASWNIQDNKWDFYDGTMYLISPDSSYRNIVRFQHQQLELPKAPLDLASKGYDYGEMSIAQAREYLKIIRLSGSEKKVRKLQVRIQEKIALPFVCLVFGIIGAALGVRPQNASKATSFGICVGLIFSYYLLSFVTSSLGISGVLTPFLAAWLPNFLGLGAGSILLYQSAK